MDKKTRTPFYPTANDPSCVLWLDFDDNYNANLVQDKSQYRSHGTISGQSGQANGYAVGMNGMAFNAEGTDDYISCGNGTNLQITGALSFSAWVNPSGTVNSPQIIAGKEGSGTDRSWWCSFNKAAGTQPFHFLTSSDGAAYVEATTSGDPANFVNQRTHVVFVYVPSASMSIYVNGALGTTVTASIPASLFNAAESLAIGARRQSATAISFFSGKISHPRLYNRALTAQEISNEYLDKKR